MPTMIPSFAPAITITWVSGFTSTPVSTSVRAAMPRRRAGTPVLGA